jgi:internalin A
LNVCQTSSGDLIGIDNFGGLKEFNFYMYNVNIKDISDLEKVLTIQRVHMNYADSVEDFSPLGKLSNLKYLSVTSQTLPGIDEIKNCQNLETLKLENFLTVDLSFISDLKNLKELYLSEKNTYIEDISFLRGLTNLETLEITCGEKSEFSVITELRNLKTLKIYNSQITDEQIEILKNEMPWCEII